MISYIMGTLVDVKEDGIIVENQGMGYEIRVPMSVMGQLPLTGNMIKIYTYMYVREDLICLYGFLQKEDLMIFKLLITVNGIGPKGALAILSSMTPDDLRFAVLAEDAKTIARAPGIGAKTASRLIIELKDKLNIENISKNSHVDAQDLNLNGQPSDLRNDTVSALVALGYSSTDAWKAVRGVEMTEDMEVEDLLKLSLKRIGLLNL